MATVTATTASGDSGKMEAAGIPSGGKLGPSEELILVFACEAVRKLPGV